MAAEDSRAAHRAEIREFLTSRRARITQLDLDFEAMDLPSEPELLTKEPDLS